MDLDSNPCSPPADSVSLHLTSLSSNLTCTWTILWLNGLVIVSLLVLFIALWVTFWFLYYCSELCRLQVIWRQHDEPSRSCAVFSLWCKNSKIKTQIHPWLSVALESCAVQKSNHLRKMSPDNSLGAFTHLVLCPPSHVPSLTFPTGPWDHRGRKSWLLHRKYWKRNS